MSKRNVPRKHHYVWRYYLEAWETDGLLFASRHRGPPFASAARGVAKENDFYRLPRLQPQDLLFAEQLIDSMGISDLAKETARNWLKPSQMILSLEARFPPGAMPLEIRTELERYEIRAEELLHSSLEQGAVPLLDALKRGDTSFWGREEGARSFCFFISVQHLRTKRGAQELVKGIENPAIHGTLYRTWPYLKFALASNMGFSFYRECADWHLRIIEAHGDLRFVTTDQPTMNLMKPVGHTDIALYYPLSPDRALFMEHASNPPFAPASGGMSDAQVDDLNLKLADYAHEQIYSCDRDYLADLVKRLGSALRPLHICLSGGLRVDDEAVAPGIVQQIVSGRRHVRIDFLIALCDFRTQPLERRRLVKEHGMTALLRRVDPFRLCPRVWLSMTIIGRTLELPRVRSTPVEPGKTFGLHIVGKPGRIAPEIFRRSQSPALIDDASPRIAPVLRHGHYWPAIGGFAGGRHRCVRLEIGDKRTARLLPQRHQLAVLPANLIQFEGIDSKEPAILPGIQSEGIAVMRLTSSGKRRRQLGPPATTESHTGPMRGRFLRPRPSAVRIFSKG